MKKVILSSIIICLATLSARASGFSIYEASIRANAMLGAFTAYADHASTIYYNPAGLSSLDGLQISGGATIIAPRTTFRGPLPYSDEEYEMADQNFAVPNFYATYQIQDGLTAGIGVYAPFGLGTKWDADWPGNFLAVETEIQTVFVNPAVGYTLPDFGIGKIQVGAGLMVAAYGEVVLKRRINNFVPGDMFELDGSLEQPAYGFNAGLLYQPVDMIRLGFTYRSSVTVDFSGDANFNDLPEFAFPSGVSGGTSIELPANWSAGLMVKPMPNLSLEVDYVWWGWSSYDELVIEFDEAIPALGGTEIVSDRSYNDTYQIRFGAEYKEFGVDGLTIMAGFAYDQNPIPNRTLDPTLPDSDRLLFSGGVSYAVSEQIIIDASYIFIRAEERKSTTAEHGLKGVYNTHANLPGLGITMKF